MEEIKKLLNSDSPEDGWLAVEILRTTKTESEIVRLIRNIVKKDLQSRYLLVRRQPRLKQRGFTGFRYILKKDIND